MGLRCDMFMAAENVIQVLMVFTFIHIIGVEVNTAGFVECVASVRECVFQSTILIASCGIALAAP